MGLVTVAFAYSIGANPSLQHCGVHGLEMARPEGRRAKLKARTEVGS